MTTQAYAKNNPLLLHRGKQAIQCELQGLKALADHLDEAFVHAVMLMRECKGRIIVTGMGKNGHIGRKVASTLASTGTPAFFVHPGEASHGDLGMITPQDVLLVLSNSGETAELGDMLSYAKRHEIAIISIVANAHSTLAQASTVSLKLPQVAEACPNGLAPTTSTTMTLALGDALAIVLLEERGFTAQDFKGFHPGGKLGQTLLMVKDLMHTGDRLPLVSLGTKMSEVLVVMTQKGFGCAGVVKCNQLVGIVTDGDLRRHMCGNLTELPVDDIMTPSPRTISPRMFAVEAVALMNAPQRPITTLFVVSDEKVEGILHIHDCLRAGLL